MITINTSIDLTEEQFLACLSVNGFPAEKQVYENGEAKKDEEGNLVTEPFTAEEWAEHLVKQSIMMPFIRSTTAKLQELHGTLRYNAKMMDEAVENAMSVSVEIV